MTVKLTNEQKKNKSLLAETKSYGLLKLPRYASIPKLEIGDTINISEKIPKNQDSDKQSYGKSYFNKIGKVIGIYENYFNIKGPSGYAESINFKDILTGRVTVTIGGNL